MTEPTTTLIIRQYRTGRWGVFAKKSEMVIRDEFKSREEAEKWLEAEMSKGNYNDELVRITDEEGTAGPLVLLEMFEFGKWTYGGYFNDRETAEIIATIYLKNKADGRYDKKA